MLQPVLESSVIPPYVLETRVRIFCTALFTNNNLKVFDSNQCLSGTSAHVCEVWISSDLKINYYYLKIWVCLVYKYFYVCLLEFYVVLGFFTWYKIVYYVWLCIQLLNTPLIPKQLSIYYYLSIYIATYGYNRPCSWG